MANIALLNRCNLRCPYCFADGYLASEKDDIQKERFLELLDFCAPDGSVGIIGGEPLLHPLFDELMEYVKDDWRFGKITVFTNGIFIDKHLPVFSDGRIQLLINLNSPSDIGASNFERIEKGIALLASSGVLSCVTVGVNVYSEGQDFSSQLGIIEKFGFKRVRLSVVIPQDKSGGGIPYFLRMKPTLLALYKELARLGVSPCYDCNAIPECVFTKEERVVLASLPFSSEFEREIFMGKRSVCSPVIDIYPDKSATRCFGCYGMKRVMIEEFESIGDLRNYFFKEIDARLVHNYPSPECADCYKNKVFGCFGGCLCYLEEKK